MHNRLNFFSPLGSTFRHVPILTRLAEAHALSKPPSWITRVDYKKWNRKLTKLKSYYSELVNLSHFFLSFFFFFRFHLLLHHKDTVVWFYLSPYKSKRDTSSFFFLIMWDTFLHDGCQYRIQDQVHLLLLQTSGYTPAWLSPE